MDYDDVVDLIDSTGENELSIPPILKSDSNKGTEYTIRAQKGGTEIFVGVQTKTYGYNDTFLGPMLQCEKGDTGKINLINELNKNTTFHWHGLEVPRNEDGGRHYVVAPSEERHIER